MIMKWVHLNYSLLHRGSVHEPDGPVLLPLGLPGRGEDDLVVGEALGAQDPAHSDPRPGPELERDPGLDDELAAVLDQDVVLDEIGRVGEGEDPPVADPGLAEDCVCPHLTTGGQSH